LLQVFLCKKHGLQGFVPAPQRDVGTIHQDFPCHWAYKVVFDLVNAASAAQQARANHRSTWSCAHAPCRWPAIEESAEEHAKNTRPAPFSNHSDIPGDAASDGGFWSIESPSLDPLPYAELDIIVRHHCHDLCTGNFL
jgi:hypothetical protein